MIQIFSNSLGSEEISAMQRIFESKWLGYGSESKLFEEEFGEKVGCKNMLGTNCCSASLLIIIKSLGIGAGDEVIISSVNFVACANVVLEVGAIPIFADVDSDYLNILSSEIERLRTKKTKAIILLHYGGHPARMDEIRETAKGLWIIEDSANSIVSKYKGKNCGTIGDAGCWSFDPMKILVTGDGGAVCFKDDQVFERAKEFRYLGITNRLSGVDSQQSGIERWWEFQLNCASNRFIINDIASAIGRVQLRKLDHFIEKRKQLWGIYQEELAGEEWLLCPPEPLGGTTSSYYLYWIRVINDLRDKLAHFLTKNGVYCTFRYFPLHLVKFYGCWNKRLPNCENLNGTVLNLPLHQNLTDGDMQKIIGLVKEFGDVS